MRRIIFLFLAGMAFCPSFASAFTVGSVSDYEAYIYLKKPFVNQNASFQNLGELTWVQILVNIEMPPASNHSERARVNATINSFISTMENNGWLHAGFQQVNRSKVPDGILTFGEDYSPKFYLTLNGNRKGVYYNPKMTLEEYFATVDEKIIRRLSNSGYTAHHQDGRNRANERQRENPQHPRREHR